MIVKGSFKAHLELHSINPVGDECITYTHCHERVIHSEMMTHRVSRNASSSRAIPWKKMKAWILADPAMPLHFGTNKPGMQSGAEIEDVIGARARLLKILLNDIEECDKLVEDFNLHKEIVNRFVEAFGFINVVSTWSRPAFMNFIALRCTPYAEPRIQRLAINMLREYKASTPQRLDSGDWHIPFIKDILGGPEAPAINTYNFKQSEIQKLLVWSVARAAWVSYRTVDDKVATYEKAKIRHDDCINLKHVTPCEHQNRANMTHHRNGGTIPGYDQYRHMIKDESVTDVDIDAILAQYEGVDFLVA